MGLLREWDGAAYNAVNVDYFSRRQKRDNRPRALPLNTIVDQDFILNLGGDNLTAPTSTSAPQLLRPEPII